jgi:periplasmic nitrate reductase NapD
MSTVHIASFIVRARPEMAATVAARIAAVPGNEVHAIDAGKIIVVVESSSDAGIADRMDEIRNEPDVLMVSLVYHQMDRELEADEETA